ncbi:stimulator of interferon genes protein isoform X2 [Bicyclus anynana]|uniref:Stimulator of interferon genes protein isoform X2 n=1 Tax=Bicyclus anynana TaxID=110368 RepID=A0A6J1MM84_BICAN|nr:stimulator of interferon genes protein isoform X2 [Bicyclus anynana]
MNNNKLYFIYGIEILFVLGLSFGSQSIHFENVQKWAVVVARYVAYLLMIRGAHEACVYGYGVLQTQEEINVGRVWRRCRTFVVLLAASLACVLYCEQRIIGEEFLLLFIAHLIVKYPEVEQPPIINYGMGMAYSFYEGYLAHIIPSDGGRFVGFQENMSIYESAQGIVFPVKRLFLVITRSLYCPPDLKHFNKSDSSLPHLEACKSLEDVEKDVAGVKGRTYRNSAYVIYRPGRRAVYLSAECATPLHTLYRVLQKKTVYEELADVDSRELVRDFCSTLRSAVHKNPESRDKCELVFYDDLDPTQNLADVLLDKIRELEPNFEEIISKRE